LHPSFSTTHQKKTASSVSNPGTKPQPAPTTSKPAAAKKKVVAQAKSAKKPRADGEHVLGGADYVTLMMGSRRRAEEEAERLPPSED
jgi:hypothetical protein